MHHVYAYILICTHMCTCMFIYTYIHINSHIYVYMWIFHFLSPVSVFLWQLGSCIFPGVFTCHPSLPLSSVPMTDIYTFRLSVTLIWLCGHWWGDSSYFWTMGDIQLTLWPWVALANATIYLLSATEQGAHTKENGCGEWVWVWSLKLDRNPWVEKEVLESGRKRTHET